MKIIMRAFFILIIFFPTYAKSLPVECLQMAGISGLVDYNCMETIETQNRAPSSLVSPELSGQLSPAMTWGNYPRVESSSRFDGGVGTYGNYILNPELPIKIQKLKLIKRKYK